MTTSITTEQKNWFICHRLMSWRCLFLSCNERSLWYCLRKEVSYISVEDSLRDESFSLYIIFELAPDLSEITLKSCLATLYASEALEFFESTSVDLKVTKFNAVPGVFWMRSEYNSLIFSHVMASETESPSNCFWLIQFNRTIGNLQLFGSRFR